MAVSSEYDQAVENYRRAEWEWKHASTPGVKKAAKAVLLEAAEQLQSAIHRAHNDKEA